MNQWDSPFPVIVPLPVGDGLSEAHLYYGESPLEVAKRLKAKSVHMIVCSPPPWGLRPYDTESQVWDGKTDCEHDWFRNKCTKCDAWKGGIGLEPTIDLYVQHLVEIFRGLRRVLRDDGTLWVNLGDSYSTSPVGSFNGGGFKDGSAKTGGRDMSGVESGGSFDKAGGSGLESKDLCGVPWRVAFALQADGWYLRNDIIWSKPNPMPESVSDRFTRSHEYIFLFSKSERYFFDQDAVREPTSDNSHGGSPIQSGPKFQNIRNDKGTLGVPATAGGRNRRTVWNIATQCYSGAHFATWPDNLVEVMVKAGTSEKGCCLECGAPLRRKVKLGDVLSEEGSAWEPTCKCYKENGRRCVVLDPFSGSGTTGRVALVNGRDYIGIDLGTEFLRLACSRIRGEAAPETVSEPEVKADSVLDIFGDD